MIKIVTDSTAYLSAEQLQKYDIRVVPLKVLFGERVFREGIDLTHEDFYRMLAEAQELPTTSQPSPGEFFEVYSELSTDGHEVISIHISSQLSRTVNSANIARSSVLEVLPEAKITIIDSLSTSASLAMMVIVAAKAAAEGRPYGEIVAMVERMIRDMNLIFVVDTLEYLQKGGRIGGARALLGTLLKIKPILCLKEGRIESLDKVRTKRKAIQRLVEIMKERVGERPAMIAIAHGEALDEMIALEKEVRSHFHCIDVLRSEIGPVVGTHSGPGILGLAAYVEGASDSH